MSGLAPAPSGLAGIRDAVDVSRGIYARTILATIVRFSLPGPAHRSIEPAHEGATALTQGDVKAALAEVLWHYSTQDLVEADPDWPSPCHVGRPDEEGMVRWRPVEMDRPVALAGLEEALLAKGHVLHPDAAVFYGSFWSCCFETTHAPSDEQVLLNVVQNDGELSWLIDSLVEHVRLQISQGFEITIPVAGTGSDRFFGLDNLTGRIVLQEPGHAPGEVVSTSLGRFLSEL
jgi:SecY interacting protein Syd